MPLALSTSTDANGNTLVNMTLAAGESVKTAVVINVDGLPLNITGYTFKMTIAFLTPLLLTTGNGGVTTTDPINGVAQINITDTVSGGFAAGSYSCDFWSISPAGDSMRLFPGTFNVLKSITAIP